MHHWNDISYDFCANIVIAHLSSGNGGSSEIYVKQAGCYHDCNNENLYIDWLGLFALVNVTDAIEKTAARGLYLIPINCHSNLKFLMAQGPAIRDHVPVPRSQMTIFLETVISHEQLVTWYRRSKNECIVHCAFESEVRSQNSKTVVRKPKEMYEVLIISNEYYFFSSSLVAGGWFEFGCLLAYNWLSEAPLNASVL